MHGGEQFLGIGIDIKFMEQRFKRGDEEGQGGAKLMTDIGEEPAFYLVKFDELFVAFFNDAAALVQFPAQSKLTIALPGIGDAATYNDNGGEHEEGGIINDVTERLRSGHGKADHDIEDEHHD